MLRQVRNWSIVALIALAVVVLPNGKTTLNIVLSILSISFFVAIALFAYRMYMEQPLHDGLAVGSPAARALRLGRVAFLNFTATSRCSTPAGWAC